ncbi:MAG: hypothetical protein ACR2FJ_09815 [Qipengyuania sp.]
MAKALDKTAHGRTAGTKVRDWRKLMSDNVASALLVYTALQIFVTVKAMREGMSSIAPYILLIILVIAIIPACRRFERRWRDLSDEQASDPALRLVFWRDLALLWALAIGLPVLLTGFFKLLFSTVA